MKTERLMDVELISAEINGVPFTKIEEMLRKPLKIGDTWYLVARHWYDRFRGHTGLDEVDYVSKDHPGPIDNSPIIDSSTDELKDNLIEDTDYVLVPEEIWTLLLLWYGLTNGQKSIPKKVVEFGVFNSYCKVEVVGLSLTLWKDFDADTAFIGRFSHGDTTAGLHEEIRRIYQVPVETKSRLWGGFSPNVFDPLESGDRSTVTIGLYHNQVVVLELQQADGSWIYQYRRMKVVMDEDNKRTISYSALPINSGASALTASPESSPLTVPEDSAEPVVEGASSVSRKIATKRNAAPNTGNPTAPAQNIMATRGNRREIRNDRGRYQASIPGVCGLANLGNTCFMNAVLQCMSNCPPITKYFRFGRHLNELNVENPLGMHGEIAKSYADLVQMMWSGEYAYALPHNFKQRVGAFAPSFSGYQQQDAQELLTFLLDGLHEDLNRIQVKPYIELRDSDGRPDEEVAEEAWSNYLRRNDSIIVDNFHGLLKSTVVCPDCRVVSVTFDPFVYLSLPLPIVKERNIDLTLFFYEAEADPIRYKFNVPKGGSIGDMVTILSGHCKVPADQLMVVQVVKSHFHQIFDSNQAISMISDADNICVYELPKFASDLNSYAVLPVCLWETANQSNNGSSNQLFGYPFVVVIARSQLIYIRIYESVMRKLKMFLYEPNDNNHCSERGNNYRGIELIDGDDISIVAPDDNRVVGDNVNESSDQNMFTLFFANDPELRDMTLMPQDGNVLEVPAVIGRRACVVGCSPAVRSRLYNDNALKNIEFKDMSANSASDSLNLSECFQHYTVEEKLGVKDAWYCPKCKKHQCASKKFDLWHLPPILVIHLKRFSFTRYRRMKLDTMVNSPLVNMDLSEYVIGPNKANSTYNLIGVTNHSGTLGGGHYTASALNSPSNTWYHFDDATVSPMTVGKSPVSKGTYVLFYMRNDVYTEHMDTD